MYLKDPDSESGDFISIEVNTGFKVQENTILDFDFDIRLMQNYFLSLSFSLSLSVYVSLCFCFLSFYDYSSYQT